MNIIKLLILLLPFSTVMAQKKQPNILLITADDLGLQVGCYGDKLAHTPNIDKLAKEGVKFTNAYVTCASCSPSRSSILTGLYPHENNQIGLSHLGFSMNDSIQTLPALLKKANYRTGIIGKLHVEPEANFPFDFKVFKQGANITRQVQTVADSAYSFIKKDKDRPFFLMVNFLDPHAELIPQVDGIPANPYTPQSIEPLPFQMVDTPEERLRIANYYSCIARLDIGLGMLLEKLKASGEAENTIIVFLGDHGAPFVRGKTSCYEAGLQIPFIVKYPGQKANGKIISKLVSTVDIVPSLLEAVGITNAPKLTGKSLTPLLSQNKVKWRKHLFGEFFYHTPNAYYPRYSVRDNTYKLIFNLADDKTNPILDIDGDQAYKMTQTANFKDKTVKKVFDRFANPPRFELYNLQQDPNEFVDLSSNPNDLAKLTALKKVLFKWIEQTKAPVNMGVNK